MSATCSDTPLVQIQLEICKAIRVLPEHVSGSFCYGVMPMTEKKHGEPAGVHVRCGSDDTRWYFSEKRQLFVRVCRTCINAYTRLRKENDPEFVAQVKKASDTYRKKHRKRILKRLTDRYQWMCEGDVTEEQLRELAIKHDKKCQYCGTRIKRFDYSPSNPNGFDHLLSRTRGGKHTIENLTVCCKPCNVQKCDKTPEEYVEWLEKQQYELQDRTVGRPKTWTID